MIVPWGEDWLLEQIPVLFLGSLKPSVTWRLLATSILGVK